MSDNTISAPTAPTAPQPEPEGSGLRQPPPIAGTTTPAAPPVGATSVQAPPVQGAPAQPQQGQQVQQWPGQQPLQPGSAPAPAFGQPAQALPVPAGAPIYGHQVANGPIGKSRSFGKVLGLTIVSLGLYWLYWLYAIHDEMKRHSGAGLGGGAALVLSLFVGIIPSFMTPKEVGDLYAARGWQQPVSGATGLWNFPGSLIVIGPFVWLFKVTSAINAYWAAVAQERGEQVRR